MRTFIARGQVVATALAVALSTIGCGSRAERPAEFRYASVAAITAQFDAHWQNRARWQYVETLGTTAGPFKGIGDHQLHAGAGKSVSYGAEGARIKYVLDIEEEVLLRRFVNPQGEPLVLVYKRRPAGASPATSSRWI
jgi:hypothetical protein